MSAGAKRIEPVPVAVDAVIGYVHRCHEKLGETLTYAQYPSSASKTDYVAAMTSEFAYVLAAEEIGKIEVPELRDRVTEEGELSRFVNVYVNDRDVRYREGLETPVGPDDTVILLPAMAGGAT